MNDAQKEKLITRVVHSALSDKTVAKEDVTQLDKLQLLRPSPAFRMTELFPGEEKTLNYSLDENCMGFLGFDAKGNLVSIDERRPVEMAVLHKDGKWIVVEE